MIEPASWPGAVFSRIAYAPPPPMFFGRGLRAYATRAKTKRGRLVDWPRSFMNHFYWQIFRIRDKLNLRNASREPAILELRTNKPFEANRS
jgi:hypothetical protein